MSVTLAEMVDYVESAINVSSGDYDTATIHRAIRAAGQHYHSVVRPASVTTNITVNSGVTNVDITATITGFVQDDLFGQEAWINQYPVRLMGYQKIARRLQGTPSTGRPTKMAFLADDALYFDLQTDQGYTLVLPHVARLTAFNDGAAGSTSLNIPTADAARLAYTGAVWYLLKGQYDEVNEVAHAGRGFQELLAEAKARYPTTEAAVIDRNVKT